MSGLPPVGSNSPPPLYTEATSSNIDMSNYGKPTLNSSGGNGAGGFQAPQQQQQHYQQYRPPAVYSGGQSGEFPRAQVVSQQPRLKQDARGFGQQQPLSGKN